MVADATTSSGTRTVENIYQLDPGVKNTWVEVSQEVVIDENFQSFRMRLRKTKDDGGSNSFDNVRLLEPVSEDSPAALAQKWKDRLDAEAAVSMQVIVNDGDPTVRKEAIDGNSNLLINGTFDTDTQNWKPNSTSGGYYEWSGGGTGGYSGIIPAEGIESVESD